MLSRDMYTGEYIQSLHERTGNDPALLENEIDLIIQEDGVLYPVEIKMTGNPKSTMASANQVLDKITDKQRGLGVILCLIGKKTFLRDNLVALPIVYI